MRVVRSLLVSCTAMAGAIAGCTGTPDTDEETSSGMHNKEAAVLAASCSGCHGPAAQDTLSDLSGLSQEAFTASMLFYRNDKSGNTVMHRLARGYTEDEIQILAGHFASKAKQ